MLGNKNRTPDTKLSPREFHNTILGRIDKLCQYYMPNLISDLQGESETSSTPLPPLSPLSATLFSPAVPSSPKESHWTTLAADCYRVPH